MAATLVTAIKNYIGTAAERVALSTTGLAAGSTFYESDGFLQVYNGTAWIPSILPTRVPSVMKSVEITRPTDTTPYAAGDLLNSTANGTANIIPKISFGAAYAGKTVMLTGVSIFTDYVTDLTKMSNFRIHFYNAQPSINDDNTAFAQTYADGGKFTGQSVDVTDNMDSLAAGGLPMRVATELCRKLVLDANGDLHFAPIVRDVITPANAQKFTFNFHFYIL